MENETLNIIYSRRRVRLWTNSRREIFTGNSGDSDHDPPLTFGRQVRFVYFIVALSVCAPQHQPIWISI
jgi:hypothetical protein